MREALLLLALLATGQPTQEPGLRWGEFHAPVYPQMARIAHISGRVVLQITVQPDGTVTIQEIEGPPILVQAAKVSVQKSKLICDGCGDEPHTFAVAYEFRIADPPRPWWWRLFVAHLALTEPGLSAACIYGDARYAGTELLRRKNSAFTSDQNPTNTGSGCRLMPHTSNTFFWISSLKEI